jgi:hypothetical protein
MYTRKREFKRYTRTDVLLVIGLSTVIFVIGGVFVGYGVASFWWWGIAFPCIHAPAPLEFIVALIISNFLGGQKINYFAVIWTWLIGIFIATAGLLGFASIIRWAIFKLLKRKR